MQNGFTREQPEAPPSWLAIYTTTFLGLLIFSMLGLLFHGLNGPKINYELDKIEAVQLATQLYHTPFDMEMKLAHHSLPQKLIAESLLYDSDEASMRLERKLFKLFAEKSGRLTIGVIGGSNTARRFSTLKFYEPLASWLRRAFNSSGLENVNVVTINAAVTATGTAYYYYCLEEMFDPSQLDILILEFAVNDALPGPWLDTYKPWLGGPMEQLIRAIWARNPSIYLILLNLFYPAKLLGTMDHFQLPVDCNWIDENEFLRIAKHYKVPSIQLKHMLGCGHNVALNKMQEHIQARHSTPDGMHATTLGHAQCGVFLIHLFRRVLERIMERKGEMGDFNYHLPEPIVSNMTVLGDGSDCFNTKHAYPFRSPLRPLHELKLVSKRGEVYSNNTRNFFGQITTQTIWYLKKNSNATAVFHLTNFTSPILKQTSKNITISLGIVVHAAADRVNKYSGKFSLSVILNYIGNDKPPFESSESEVLVPFQPFVTTQIVLTPIKSACSSYSDLESADVIVRQLSETYELKIHSAILAYFLC